MHEFSIAKQLMSLVEQEVQLAKAERLLKVNVLLGEQSHIESKTLTFYFDLLSKESPCLKDAKLTISRQAMRFYCPQCKLEYPGVSGDFSCPDCQSLGQLINMADQIYLESIEVSA